MRLSRLSWRKNKIVLHLRESKDLYRNFEKEGIKVAHVVSSVKFALKCQDAGVDAVVAEGFERWS